MDYEIKTFQKFTEQEPGKFVRDGDSYVVIECGTGREVKTFDTQQEAQAYCWQRGQAENLLRECGFVPGPGGKWGTRDA